METYMQAGSPANRPLPEVEAAPADALTLLAQARNAAFREASQGRLGLGLVLLESALEYEPMSHEVLSDMAALLLAAGELDQAVVYARRALALRSDHAPSHYALGFALAGLGHIGESAQVLDRLLKDPILCANLTRETPDLLPLVQSELERLQAHLQQSTLRRCAG